VPKNTAKRSNKWWKRDNILTSVHDKTRPDVSLNLYYDRADDIIITTDIPSLSFIDRN
jgi:hypothetical protein